MDTQKKICTGLHDYYLRRKYRCKAGQCSCTLFAIIYLMSCVSPWDVLCRNIHQTIYIYIASFKLNKTCIIYVIFNMLRRGRRKDVSS